ncbi:putative versatile peroxidase [Mycena leptocephala]|nr:putative versatile peroxidase [Mycena leptocephala]
MKISTLSALSLVYITTVSATYPARAACSKGRTAASATCCVWYDVLDDIQANLFEGGQCGDDAHDALRLSFHDAIGYSPNLKRQNQFGGDGADGSLIKFADPELTYHANVGLETIVYDEKALADKYHVSYGDIIQFAAAVSVRNCAGGPRISFMAGRPDATQAAPVGLVPEPFDSVDTILDRVGDAGLTPEELIDLLASHSVGFQEDVDPTIIPTPFDLTPSVFDTNFYRDTQFLLGTMLPRNGTVLHQGEVKTPFKNEFRLQSDYALAHDSRTSSHWTSLALSHTLMSTRFATAMAKMALLGQNPNILQDCSEVIPAPGFSLVF